ncbi:hypothetical protein DET50_12438 [Marinobacter pelagius]|uniref:Uncharacterized protein n=1 Tax=Marinobacter pelagius TaxID=379482 RepID=A0A366GG83_9GAMM|nr:hypothetical protein [Marinobacter pelagius]RBP25045.1 hypothetical protein DET50_12438 [Marinobacter pelagius]
MNTQSDELYIQNVKAMAERGMEIRLLSGRSVRELGNPDATKSTVGMSRTIEAELMKWCVESLAVSAHQARALVTRDSQLVASPYTKKTRTDKPVPRFVPRAPMDS